MRIIKIFLASSEELKPERMVIAELITKLNYLWAEYDISLRLVKWEYLDSSMGTQHKQDDYNDYLRVCDMCVVLYWTKFGMYTEIELETAYQLINADSHLKQMTVMFKDGHVMTPELKNFKHNFESQHPELCQTFTNGDHLTDIFSQQILKCVKNKIDIEHEQYSKKVRRFQKLLEITEEDDPDYKEYQHELESAKNDLAKNENIISDLERTTRNI